MSGDPHDVDPWRAGLAPVLAALALLTGCGGADGGGEPAATTPATTGSGASPRATPGAAVTQQELRRRLRGVRVVVGRRRVALDLATLTCVGVGGRAAGAGSHGAWRRFRCVQPTFPPGETVGPDVVFFAEAEGAGGVRVSGARFVRY